MKRSSRSRELLLGALGVFATGAMACANSKTAPPKTANPAAQDSPNSHASMAASAPDDSFVWLTGVCTTTAEDHFVLDYGGGTMTVEMDEWKSYTDLRPLLDDDEVLVYGFIDDDFYDERTMEAVSIYLEDLGTQFFVEGVDRQDLHTANVKDYPPRIQLTGTVLRAKDGEFTLQTEGGPIDVDTDSLPYDPLDGDGYQSVAKGDEIRVMGLLDRELFDGRELIAESVVSLE